MRLDCDSEHKKSDSKHESITYVEFLKLGRQKFGRTNLVEMLLDQAVKGRKGHLPVGPPAIVLDADPLAHATGVPGDYILDPTVRSLLLV